MARRRTSHAPDRGSRCSLRPVTAAFGGRHELYERNYLGASETVRFATWQMAQASGLLERTRGFADQCMAEYDLEGWTSPDLITPHDVNLFLKKPTGA